MSDPKPTEDLSSREPLNSAVTLVDYDPSWPELFRQQKARIEAALGRKAVRVEHAGSTAVPGLCAKPVLDIVLEVPDSADEPGYVAALEAAGYHLKIREPDWHEHRLFKGTQPAVNLHVFSNRCSEVARMLQFRDWLRANEADRTLYARTKRALARQKWGSMQDYADAKTSVVNEILVRAQAARDEIRQQEKTRR